LGNLRIFSLYFCISFGLTPAVLLLSYGNFEPIYSIGVFIMLSATAIRLSYFSTYGLSGGTKYTGLAVLNVSEIKTLGFTS